MYDYTYTCIYTRLSLSREIHPNLTLGFPVRLKQLQFQAASAWTYEVVTASECAEEDVGRFFVRQKNIGNPYDGG